MSLTDGQQALIRRIVTMTTTANIALPNGPGVGLPRFVVQEAGGSQRTITVDGITYAKPEIVVRVETTAGEYATENNAFVSELVARFPVGLRTDDVTIDEAPNPRPPIPGDDGIYSVPVIIRGTQTF